METRGPLRSRDRIAAVHRHRVRVRHGYAYRATIAGDTVAWTSRQRCSSPILRSRRSPQWRGASRTCVRRLPALFRLPRRRVGAQSGGFRRVGWRCWRSNVGGALRSAGFGLLCDPRRDTRRLAYFARLHASGTESSRSARLVVIWCHGRHAGDTGSVRAPRPRLRTSDPHPTLTDESRRLSWRRTRVHRIDRSCIRITRVDCLFAALLLPPALTT